MKYFYAVALFILTATHLVHAQTPTQSAGFRIDPLSINPVLEHYTAPPQAEGARPDSINLPFIEDFSYTGPFPDNNLWLDKQIFVNNTMSGDSMPTVGIATFDGISATGKAYSSFNSRGWADTLTSNFINLKDIVDASGVRRPLSIGDSVAMSFYLQMGGLGYIPSDLDSIVLEFRDNAGNWNMVQRVKGLPDSVINKLKLTDVQKWQFFYVPIRDVQYFYSKFQFRFRNATRLNGAFDFWHLDFVKIAPTRRLATARSLDDLAFSGLPPFVLRRYTSMPWKHARPQLSTEVQDTFNAVFYNHFAQTRNPTNTNARVTTSTGITAVSAITLANALNVPPSVFLATAKQVLPNSLRLQLGNVPETTEKLTVTTEYTLQIEGQEGKDTFRAASRNDRVVRNTEFADYFAYDDGSAEYQFSATGANKSIAIQFKTNVADTLRGVQFFFPHIKGDAPPEAYFTLRVWRGNLTSTPAYERRGIFPFYLDKKADSLQGFTTFRLENRQSDGKYKDTAIVIPAGDFYVGWQIPEDWRIPIGLDRNNLNKSQYLWESDGGSWRLAQVPSAPNDFIGAVMVRPLFSKKTPVPSSALSVKESVLADVMNIYPNPTHEKLFFNFKNNYSADLDISVFNAIGKFQKRSILRGGNELDVSDLAAGFYVLSIRDRTNQKVWTHKFSVQK